MPIYQEATFHDRQSMKSSSSNSTLSTDYIDLPGATITTKSLAQDGDYIVFFSVLVSASLNNTKANFRLSIGGVPVDVNGTDLTLKIKDLDVGYSVNGNAPLVPPESVIKVEYKTDKGTIIVTEFGILVDGVPCSRVVA